MSVLKDKILNTATDLFQTRGINSTGVDTIVAVAGTTKMTLKCSRRVSKTFKIG